MTALGVVTRDGFSATASVENFCDVVVPAKAYYQVLRYNCYTPIRR